MKEICRYVPELAYDLINQTLETSKPCFKYEKSSFYFIIDLFYRLPTYNKNVKYTNEGLLRISSKYFSKYITKGYAKYTNWLIKNKIILCDKIKKDDKAYGYKLCPYLESKIIKVKLSKLDNITKRIIDNYNKRKKYHKKLPDHIKKMKSFFKNNLKIDSIAAIKWLDEQLRNETINLTEFNIYLLSIQAIEDQELYFKINSTNGRLDSNITNLKSELRQFIIGDFKHIDCQNSQPLLINLVIDYIKDKSKSNLNTGNIPKQDIPSLGDKKEEILSKQLSAKDLKYLKFFPHISKKSLREFEKFSKNTFGEDFYLTLQSDYQKLYGKEISRKEIKNILYKVFFSRNTSYGPEKAIFRKLYPTIYSIIYNLKKKQHNKFAICLQRIESEIFIQTICKELVAEGIIPLTIHDSIIVIDPHKDRALEIMKKVYMDFLNKQPKFVCTEL